MKVVFLIKVVLNESGFLMKFFFLMKVFLMNLYFSSPGSPDDSGGLCPSERARQAGLHQNPSGPIVPRIP